MPAMENKPRHVAGGPTSDISITATQKWQKEHETSCPGSDDSAAHLPFHNLSLHPPPSLPATHLRLAGESGSGACGSPSRTLSMASFKMDRSISAFSLRTCRGPGERAAQLSGCSLGWEW